MISNFSATERAGGSATVGRRSGRFPSQSGVVRILLILGMVFCARPARAELVFFASGRSLSVKGHRTEGSLLVLSLRAGGEVVSDASLIVRITPDEVPYPEPAAAASVAEAPFDNRLEAAALVTGSRYDTMIQKAANEQGVDARLVRAVIQVESAYQQRARSRRGAMGLMQLMPETARRYGVGNAYDPQANIEAGIRHLKDLLTQFPLTLALAAYNAGAAAVERFGGIPPYPETQAYVAKVLRLIGS